MLLSSFFLFANSELKVFKNKKVSDEISNNWLNDLLGINIYKTLKPCWLSLLTILQWTNTTSVISKWGIFSVFLSSVIFLLMLPSNFNISGVKSLR